ncbi:MAG: UPF0149 family protein [Gammaproteobacteria bacterium]|jgi:hypothetical protein
MLENQSVEYDTVDEALRRAASAVQAADCHGLLCGLICAAGFADPRLWLGEVFDDFNPRDAQQGEAYRLTQALSEQALARLNSPDLDFELLLPDVGCPLRERTESLGDWCSGFLSGLGLGGLPGRAGLPEAVGEIVEDLAEIARVDFELDRPGEEEQAAFEEVVEYIRVGTLLIHEELQPAVPPQRLS